MKWKVSPKESPSEPLKFWTCGNLRIRRHRAGPTWIVASYGKRVSKSERVAYYTLRDLKNNKTLNYFLTLKNAKAYAEKYLL